MQLCISTRSVGMATSLTSLFYLGNFIYTACVTVKVGSTLTGGVRGHEVMKEVWFYDLVLPRLLS